MVGHALLATACIFVGHGLLGVQVDERENERYCRKGQWRVNVLFHSLLPLH
jgi:hypothetical protein